MLFQKKMKNCNKSGFIPVWIEITVKPSSIVGDMNK